LLDSFLSLRPQERHLKYNRELLPLFYGLLHAALEHEGLNSCTHGCLHILQAHRNWEWAVRYLVVESTDYANLEQLQVALQPNQLDEKPMLGERCSLAVTLFKLLDICSRHAPFRLKMLNNTLYQRTDVISGNVLTLLDVLIETAEDKALACELSLLPRLTGSIELVLSRAVSNETGGWVSLHLAMRIAARLAGYLCAIEKRDPSGAHLRQRVLKAWGFGVEPSRALSLLSVSFWLLAPALRMPTPTTPSRRRTAAMIFDYAAPEGAFTTTGCNTLPSVGNSPSDALLETVYELSAALANLDCQCATLMLTTLTAHHDQQPTTEMDTADLSGSRTLAGLRTVRARALATSSAALSIIRHYDYVSAVLYNSLNGHLSVPTIVRSSIHLALRLMAEVAVLPTAMHGMIKVLRQVAVLSLDIRPDQRDHPMALSLRAELSATMAELRARTAPDASPTVAFEARDVFTCALIHHHECLSNLVYVATLQSLLAAVGVSATGATANGAVGEPTAKTLEAECHLPSEWLRRARAELARQRIAAATIANKKAIALVGVAEALLAGDHDALAAALPHQDSRCTERLCMHVTSVH